MQAGRDTITIRQDSSDIVRWVFSDDTGLIDWTGWTARVQVRREAARAAELLAELSTVDGTMTMTTYDTPGSFGQRLRELFPQHWGIH